MSKEEFVNKMKEHNLSIKELAELYEQWEKFNYIARIEVRESLNKEVKSNE